ncbi:MAG: glycosyltransferase, partial [candidate division Zixibacteria bacterium]|nr:glycosyltransferase [candidate division Zixibacteria bacterium]
MTDAAHAGGRNVNGQHGRKQPLVSILATSYNHEKYIRQCVDSLVRQTYANIEITVVDDCST